MKFSIAQACELFGVTRQAFYKDQRRETEKFLRQAAILEVIKEIRARQPRVGTRKIHKMLGQSEIRIGRDYLFEFLGERKLLIKPKKNFRKTTNSYHRFRKHQNLIRELEIDRPNQVFVSDITYLDTLEGHCYLTLITDLYSRKIVGWNVSRSLAVEGCQKAVRMALKGVKKTEDLIHHSDRGYQFCSPRYTGILEKHKVRISMTEQDHVYENAVAERVNGILKIEFLLGERLNSLEDAARLAAESIKTYNEQRLHTSLNYRTPSECYAA
jgi:putative transposase